MVNLTSKPPEKQQGGENDIKQANVRVVQANRWSAKGHRIPTDKQTGGHSHCVHYFGKVRMI